MADTERHKQFFDVEMPRWYRILSWTIRILCAVSIAVVLIWRSNLGIKATDTAVFIIIGIALVAALPSLPKAYIEQKNRLRGLKDGTLQDHINTK